MLLFFRLFTSIAFCIVYDWFLIDQPVVVCFIPFRLNTIVVAKICIFMTFVRIFEEGNRRLLKQQ